MLDLIRKALRKPWILNILVLLAAAVLLWPFVLDVYNALDLGRRNDDAGEHDVFLVDEAELFSPEEERELRQQMQKPARYCAVFLMTTRDTGSKGHAAYAEWAFQRAFSDGDGILFLIDLDNRQLRLQKNDDNPLLSTELCESITDNVYRYASAGDYYGCARSAFSQVTAVMGGSQIPQPMKHSSNLLIALCLGLMAAFWAALRQNDVNRPDEVYQINRRACRSITFTDGKLRQFNSADYAGTLGELASGLIRGIGELAASDSGGSWSSGGGSSRSGSGNSGRSGSGGSSRSGSGRSGSGSSGGSHRF